MNSNKAHQVGPQGPLHSKYSANTFCFSHFIQAVVDFFFFFSFLIYCFSLFSFKGESQGSRGNIPGWNKELSRQLRLT